MQKCNFAVVYIRVKYLPFLIEIIAAKRFKNYLCVKPYAEIVGVIYVIAKVISRKFAGNRYQLVKHCEYICDRDVATAVLCLVPNLIQGSFTAFPVA